MGPNQNPSDTRVRAKTIYQDGESPLVHIFAKKDTGEESIRNIQWHWYVLLSATVDKRALQPATLGLVSDERSLAMDHGQIVLKFRDRSDWHTMRDQCDRNTTLLRRQVEG